MSDLQSIYLDWNVFNKLEHLPEQLEKGELEYSDIYQLISLELLLAPYSNAHINDLLRGYSKDPSYTPGHLANITTLSQSICLTQYWGESKVRWHKRDPEEYLKSTLDENETTPSSFSSLFSSLDDPLMEYAFDLQKLALRMNPVPIEFKKIYSLSPIFNSIYPRTKVQMNHLALCEDIYDFAFKIKNDFTLYKHFRKFLTESKAKYPQYRDMLNNADNNIIGNPKYLTWDEMWDSIDLKTKSSKNLDYDKIMGLFTTTDLKGYRADERFANLIDDALHCFYAAHCDYFITLDSRCYDKAKLVYKKLNIGTLVFTPLEFKTWLSDPSNSLDHFSS